MGGKEVKVEHYELLTILSSKTVEDEVEKILEKIKGDIIAEEGEITRAKNLGKKRLSYPIQHMRYGYYLLVEFNLEQSKFRPLDKKLSLSAGIVRHQMIKVREKTEEEIRREAERRERPEKAGEEKVTAPFKTPVPAERPVIQKPRLEIELEEKVTRPLGEKPLTAEEKIAGPAAAEAPEKRPKEKKVTLEELDEKLDKILEDDIIDD